MMINIYSYYLNFAIILGGSLTAAGASQKFNRVGSLHAENSTEINVMYDLSVIRCASRCHQENSCFGYHFDPTTSQCEFFRGCIRVINESDGSGRKSYEKNSKTNLALGRNATASGYSHFAANTRRLTDGQWLDIYTRDSSEEIADVFCTNDAHEYDERWIQIDLERSFVICAVDFYDRVDSEPMRGDMLVTVNDDPQLLTSRDQSECGFRQGLMPIGEWNLIACDSPKKGRYVRISPLSALTRHNVRLCAYEILIYGF